jgi:hypothetical protein
MIPTIVAVTRSIPAGGTSPPDATVRGTSNTTATDNTLATTSFMTSGRVSMPSRTVGSEDTPHVVNATSRTARPRGSERVMRR